MADRGFSSSQKCYNTATILEMGGEVVSNSDGSVSVYMLNNVGVLAPVVLNKTCCEALGAYIFDVDSQKCMSAANPSTCSINDVFNVVLNPKGNAGALFYAEPDEFCQLSVDFDYLFKVKCETLSEMISGKHVGGVIAQINPGIELIPTKDSLSLAAQIKEQETLCASFSFQLEQINKELNSTPYSIECLYSQTQPVKTSTGLIEPYFTKTAFGGNASIAPFGLYFATSTGTFCLTDNGLSVWEKILGQIRYQSFLDGDPNSYSCADVQNIVDQNANNLLKGEPELVYECTIPFGTRTNLILQQREISKNLEACRAILNELSVRSETISPVALPILNPVIEQVSNCSSPIDFFESFSVSMTVELVTSANTLQTVYEQPLFGPIGSGNLYNYLATAGTASGFYVCGDPNSSETSFNGCTPLLFEFEGTDVDNVTACQTVMTNILDGLFQESGLSGQTDGASIFQDSLSVSALTSHWLHFNTLITDPTVLSAITNQPIKISFKINSTCGNFCILVDEISLNKVCTKVKDTSLFISQPPSFNLERIHDNKKSWVANNTPVNRVFDMKNVFGTNPIRQTNYDVNDERLVINTKEIDLDINIAAGIENDVWCYIVDNPCLLSATCTPLETSCPTGYTFNGSICVSTDTVPYTLSETMYTASTLDSGTTTSINGIIGGWFYEDITTRPWPVYSLTGGSYTTAATMVDSASNIVNVLDKEKNMLWGGYEISPGIPYGWWLWRLNVVGVWDGVVGSGPEQEWIGFSECINIPETKTYVIGMAADDAIRVSLNGQSMIELIGDGYQWSAWRLFPVTLNAGDNIFKIEGYQGQLSTPASFGFEIYDAPISTLTGLTGNTQIDPYVLWSTKDLNGQVMNVGENSGYICPLGYTYDPCIDACVITLTADTITTGDCCDPCSNVLPTCGNKQFQDDFCYEFMDSNVYEFMDGNFISGASANINGSFCCGDEIDFNKLMTQPLSAVTTIEDFEYFLTSELIDAKNRQTISRYATLKALYERYLNSNEYCGTKSSAFNYMTMDQFAGLIDSYWVDIVEQVIPATTIWGSVKIYSNTLFDQQKYKYRAYTSLLCGNPYSGKTILSPINGTTGQCADVEVITSNVVLANQENIRMKPVLSVCDSICIAQMNMGSEFIGKVSIVGAPPKDCSVSDGSSINECALQVSVTTTYPHADAVVVGAVGDVTYLWGNGETGSTATFLTAGTYTLTVTDSNCCEFTTEFYMPEPQLTACWYSMQESPSYVHFGLVCDGTEFSSITFTLSSMVVNGEELVTSAYTKTINSGTTNFVYANNTNLSGCTLGSPTGMTYTDFVDLLNEAFADLGLTYYHAQLSYVGKQVYDAINDELVNPAGFYIIRPVNDTFSIKTVSNVGSPYSLLYTDNSLTNWAGSPINYYAMTCNGITLENNVVVE